MVNLTNGMRRSPVIIFLMFSLSLLLMVLDFHPADAVPTLMFDDDPNLFEGSETGLTPITVVDNMPGDTSGVPGVVGFTGGFDAFSINIVTGLTKPLPGYVNDMDLHSVQVSSSGLGGTMYIWFSEDFFGPAGSPAGVTTTVGGTTEGSVSFTTYVDNSNTPFGTGTVVGTSPTFTDLSPGFPPLGFNTTYGNQVMLADSFSMTAMAKVEHAGVALTSFDMFITVPELETYLLLGICVLCLAGIKRKMKENDDQFL